MLSLQPCSFAHGKLSVEASPPNPYESSEHSGSVSSLRLFQEQNSPGSQRMQVCGVTHNWIMFQVEGV